MMTKGVRHRTTRLAKQSCWNCRKVIDSATHFVDGKRTASRPKPGDFNICLGCNAVSVFDEELMLRQPTADELIKIANDPEVMRLSYAVAKVIQRRKQH